EGQPHVALLCRDVSARVSLEAQLLQAQGHAVPARILSGVAHDSGGLFAVIRAAAEFLATGLPDDGPEQDALNSIQSAIERGEALRRQVLNLGRVRAASFEII